MEFYARLHQETIESSVSRIRSKSNSSSGSNLSISSIEMSSVQSDLEPDLHSSMEGNEELKLQIGNASYNEENESPLVL